MADQTPASEEAQQAAASGSGQAAPGDAGQAGGEPQPWYRRALDWLWTQIKAVVGFFWGIIQNIAITIRAAIFLFVNTPSVLLPSVVHTTLADERYNRWLIDQLTRVSQEMDLDPIQKEVLVENWINQIDWVSKRANRERDANELIRWWQIILGVLIPVLIQIGLADLASLSGVFVAVITAVHQFRRPEDRWRHYRMLTERYQIEFWSFVTRSDPEYTDKTHKEAFHIFNERMNELKREELAKFFGEVVPPSAGSAVEERVLRAQERLFAPMGGAPQGTTPPHPPAQPPA